MEIKVTIPDYSSINGLQLDWEEDFEIFSSVENDIVTIRANSAGLISLAKHLLILAQVEVPTGSHIHLDELNSLETDSAEIILEKI
ncbi:hypothetical protein QE450_004330 [Paenibacillus sp. SORGH_AS306]|uniref:Imm32 family immunity protein n=1 Tax=unclassified Paenibacillus TaxID=185978 RepID=UPI002781E02D|nr:MULTISPECIES: hypothetical protein [unclassified Paenibacillus]MDQ1236832.1 hypothetical protein [Paenibacillus sp. SORGH_AS_0306]MDR6109193.1 hypothetical protein [Paenibacillus sp. SORGH_AS_0338]